MSKFLSKFLLIGFFLFSGISFSQTDVPLFDRGPDPSNPMHRELIELIQEIPFVPGLSEQLEVLVPSYKKGQKMRPDFGAMILRGLLEENSVKVLVIGQDGTHIAEGANRPGIAGFGGRVQDMLKHFGIVDGVLFTNLFVNTISGQYGVHGAPVLEDGSKISFRNKVIENRQWLLTHDGPYSKWRNRLIDWVIRNNQESLKMVMMLGGAGKDAGANYINARGGSVGASKFVGDASRYKVPLFEMVSAGGNNEFAVAITKDGKDVANEMRKDKTIKKAYETQNKARYKKIVADMGDNESVKADVEKFLKTSSSKQKSTLMTKIKKANKTVGNSLVKYDKVISKINALGKPYNYKDSKSTEFAKAIMTDFPKKAKRLMVFTNGGHKGTGVLNPQQIGGWDLRTMEVEGKKTRSIKGLSIPTKDGFIVAPDVVFTGSPHPTSLSKTAMSSGYDAAARQVETQLIDILKEEQKRGWTITPEAGQRSAFLAGEPYKYGRALIPISHGDPGITPLRLLPVSTAKRAGKSAIIIGTRGNANFSSKLTKQMEKDKPSSKFLIDSDKVLTGRPQFDDWIFKYDRGPSNEVASILFNTLDETEVFAPHQIHAAKMRSIIGASSRAGQTKEEKARVFDKAVSSVFAEHGIDAFPAKTYKDAGFYGHYRGTFDNPKVLILADPHGHDSFITSKAATGERGQYLNGLMQDLGVGHEYLVLNTVPFGMDEASSADWQEVLTRTQNYRDQILNHVLSANEPTVIIADGIYAEQELKRIVGDNKFVTIKRSRSMSNDMKNAGKEIKKKVSGFSRKKINGKRIDIPREHLTWIARTWEGTSGDRVITATGKEKGKVFKIVAPDWARKNKVKFTDQTALGLDNMRAKLLQAGEPLPGEKMPDFIKRAKIQELPIDCVDFF